MGENVVFRDLGDFSHITIRTETDTYILLNKEDRVTAEDICVTLQTEAGKKTVYLTAEGSAVRDIKIRWNLPMARDAKILCDAWERSYGELHWQCSSADRVMPWYFIAADKNRVTGFGVSVRPSAMCWWEEDTRGVTLTLDVRCGGEGVILGGRTLKLAEILCMEAENIDTFRFAQGFCRAMCTDPVLPDHPVYGGNNWYYAYGDSSEEEILRDADYICKLTRGAANTPYMIIDDCWQENHRLGEYNGGPWTAGNAKFPDMKKLAEKLKEKGVIPGIWLRLLQNEDPAIPDTWRTSMGGFLDPSHPEVLQYIRRDVERICQWGYRLIKHDYTTFDLFGRWGIFMNAEITKSGWHFYDRSKTSAEIIKMLYRTIYETANQYGVLIMGCNTVGHLGAGLMHINRTGDDTSGKIWQRTRKMGVNTLGFRLPQHEAFYAVDADCVGIAGGIPWPLNRQWAQVLARSGTPLFVSVKPGLLNDREERELHDIMVIASEQKLHQIPLDWEYTDLPELWGGDKTESEYNWFLD